MFYDFITIYTDIFVEKMREAFASFSHVFNKKYWCISDNISNFNEMLTNVLND